MSLCTQLFKMVSRDFRGGPVVKILCFNAGDVGSVPAQGAEMHRWILYHLSHQGSPDKWEAHLIILVGKANESDS